MTVIHDMDDKAEPKMRASDVSVFYGDKKAIDDVSIDIPTKFVTAFIGPSGCGKSTFLRTLNRMNDTIPSARVEGQIELDGEDIYSSGMDVVQLQARVGMVFQKPNPFPKSIYENIAYGPKIHGLAESKGELDEIVERSLQRAGLWNEVKDRLGESGTALSGGQQQRLCIARAIAVDPEVILMDEPASALLGPRSHRDRPGRGADRRAARELFGRDRHPLHAAGGARFAADRLFPPRQDGRIWSDGPDLYQSARRTNQRLYHRTLRMISEHTVKAFDEDITRLRGLITEMGGLAETALEGALDALIRGDEVLAERIVADDRKLDALESEVDRLAVKIIALRAPMADDLREVIAALKIAGVVERIGDYAKNIAKRVGRIEGRTRFEPLTLLPAMADVAAEMVHDVLTAYAARDAALAREVIAQDKKVDAFYNSIFRNLVSHMVENPATISSAAQLLFVARNIERIGDHATNVAEMVYFAATGDYPLDEDEN